MESQQRKPYVKPSIRAATPEETARFEREAKEDDTWPGHEAPTFLCTGCMQERPSSAFDGNELCRTCVEVLP